MHFNIDRNSCNDRRELSWQRAVAVPIGRLMSDGRVMLDDGVETPGVMWESERWRLTDNGVIFFKNESTGTGVRVAKGVQYFGFVNEADNMFRLLPDNQNFPTTLDQVLNF